MFGVKYDTWKSVCDMYFSLKTGSLKAYLQWFPFTKLTKEDKDIISSEEFYNKYIENGSFILFPPAMHQSENFLQKSDGSFRDSSLVGPILYLMLQAVGKEIYDQYVSVRPYTKLFKLQFSGASGNNTNLTQFIYSSRRCFSLSAIIFIIIIIWSAFIIHSRATEIVNHVIIYT